MRDDMDGSCSSLAVLDAKRVLAGAGARRSLSFLSNSLLKCCEEQDSIRVSVVG